MTLLEYVQSLQEQGATDIPAKGQEWKKKNQPEVEEKVIETPVEEVKPSKFNEDGSLNVDSFSEETKSAAEKVNEKKKNAAAQDNAKAVPYTHLTLQKNPSM